MGNKKENYTYVDLFAGIGGFHLAMNELGAKCVYAAEWDENCRKTYQAKVSGNIKDGFTITNTHTVVRPPIPKTGVE